MQYLCHVFYFSEIFPYLVVIVGLENVLVVTKSVVSTPVHMDVKLRVAQGLIRAKNKLIFPKNLFFKLFSFFFVGISKEGWYITKNLICELAILAIGFLTFVPAIQVRLIKTWDDFYDFVNFWRYVVLQEFCLFAVVGLLTDFFLQMFFFTTVLSIDIRRMEVSSHLLAKNLSCQKTTLIFICGFHSFLICIDKVWNSL